MRMRKRQIISVADLARGVLAYRGTPSAELKSACASYLASLNPVERRREVSLRMPVEERTAHAKAAIAARWSKRPAGELPADQVAILLRLRGLESVTIKAVGPRRRAAIVALAAAGRIRVLSQSADEATLSSMPAKSAK
jgi:hypothetical protein